MAGNRQIFVNLPVKNLNKSMDFFGNLGFKFNPQFSDTNGAAMVVGDDSFVMLLTEDFFKTFTKKPLCDAAKNTEVIVAVSAASRSAVDEMVQKALAADGKASNDRYDMGWMYGWSFQDLDGHLWEVVYMDPNAANQGQDAPQAATTR